MKLGACLVSSDLNPDYLDFFPLVNRTWKKLVGVPAILALVANEIPEPLLSMADDIILIPPVKGIHTALQAQCVRLFAPQLLAKRADGAVITSDIDMLPMNRRYYVEPIEPTRDDAFVVYRSNMLMPDGEIAICYNAALPGTWADLTGRTPTIDAIRARLAELLGAAKYAGTHGGDGWGTDQRLLHQWVARFPRERVALLADRRTGFARLDRHGRGLTPIQRHLARRGFYSDFHMYRPQAVHAATNEAAAALALDASGRAVAGRLLQEIDRLPLRFRALLRRPRTVE